MSRVGRSTTGITGCDEPGEVPPLRRSQAVTSPVRHPLRGSQAVMSPVSRPSEEITACHALNEAPPCSDPTLRCAR